MRARRPPLFLLFIAVSMLVPAPARAEMPERLVGQNGRATVEALAGSRVTSPAWERAGEIGQEEYMAVVARLLDATVWLEEWPRQELDPNDPRPRRAVVLRLVIGEEEHVRQALRGAPYETLRGLADMVIEFSRTAKGKP
jgi:hypothetical protein